MTNRDFYILITQLIKSETNNQRTLEEYLRAFWSLSQKYKNNNSISVNQFLELLKSAFITTIPPFDDRWRQEKFEQNPVEEDSFLAFEATILDQIVDLREMDEADFLSDDMRYFGLDSSRGGRWYNFIPQTYIEAATCGKFGGWQEGDSTSRQYVSGEVAYLAEDGSIRFANPQDLTKPTIHLGDLSWETIREFFWYGQNYE